MAQMKYLKLEAHEWLCKIPFEFWGRHAFQEDLKNDHITNNNSKSFNSWVGVLRGKPFLTLMETLTSKKNTVETSIAHRGTHGQVPFIAKTSPTHGGTNGQVLVAETSVTRGCNQESVIDYSQGSLYQERLQCNFGNARSSLLLGKELA
ncbi:hypothetical protein ACH5RR_026535 [Cinchona calisaya]|uniref:Uncharacterized protein n=1 Tax=Cinchona calisaya TaxID=153742 RepID=A0ABD2Z3Y0_9GENT